MNFTREPIVETVIMPREGCKLLVRNSKSSGQEEYYVESIEVVSFGASLFFRSQERPKSFLVPVSDYEIIEQKEVRMALKNAAPERSIKIGGGRSSKDEEPQEREAPEPRERKREKRRRGRRGSRSESTEAKPRPKEEVPPPKEAPPPEEGASPEPSPEAVSGEGEPSFISKLFPPPPTLIKETLSRYKPMESEEEEILEEKEEKIEEVILEAPISEEPQEEETPPEE